MREQNALEDAAKLRYGHTRQLCQQKLRPRLWFARKEQTCQQRCCCAKTLTPDILVKLKPPPPTSIRNGSHVQIKRCIISDALFAPSEHSSIMHYCKASEGSRRTKSKGVRLVCLIMQDDPELRPTSPRRPMDTFVMLPQRMTHWSLTAPSTTVPYRAEISKAIPSVVRVIRQHSFFWAQVRLPGLLDVRAPQLLRFQLLTPLPSFMKVFSNRTREHLGACSRPPIICCISSPGHSIAYSHSPCCCDSEPRAYNFLRCQH